DRPRVLAAIAEHSGDDQQIFVGVTDPIDPRIESAEEVRDRVIEAARHIPLERLGTTDDCGFSPFGDDTSTARETPFAEDRAPVPRRAAPRAGAGAPLLAGPPTPVPGPAAPGPGLVPGVLRVGDSGLEGAKVARCSSANTPPRWTKKTASPCPPSCAGRS